MKRVKILGLFLTLIMLLGAKYEETFFEGLVVRVIDGDTFVFQSKLFSRESRMRIYGIDAPESKQLNSLGTKIGHRSTNYLKALIEKKRVKVKLIKIGYYGRQIVKVFKDNEDIGLKMVKDGYALTSFYYDYDSRKMKLNYEAAMNIAMMKRVGIWSRGSFERPDYFRKLTKRKTL